MLLVAAGVAVSVTSSSGASGVSSPVVAPPVIVRLPSPSRTPVFVAHSTHKVCRLTGAPETATQAVGLVAGDHGYPFLDRGQLVFLFGDSIPTQTFPLSSSISNTDRWNTDFNDSDPRSYANDSIATASPKLPPGSCPVLTYPTQDAATGGAPGAYVDPHVIVSGSGGPGNEVSLRANEAPVSGISEHGQMFVIFKTNNPIECPAQSLTSGSTSKLNCDGTLGFGAPYTSVVAMLERGKNATPLTFKYLYTLSGPPVAPAPHTTFTLQGCPVAGKFDDVAIEHGAHGYVYLWGTSGGVGPGPGNPCNPTAYAYHSNAFLARIPATQLANGVNGGPPRSIRYLSGVRHGEPQWASSESQARALFSNGTPCMAELGVQWNPYLGRWVMLYNCKNNTHAHPNGIWMRTAPHPWGPWSSAQTILNPDPATHLGFCWLIHDPSCSSGPNPCNPGVLPCSKQGKGSYYGPYIVPGWTTVTRPEPGVITTTFYYTLDTFNPYGQWIMKSSITFGTPIKLGTPPPHIGPCPHVCKPT